MSEIITITKEELKRMIAAEVAKNSLPRVKKDFRDVMVQGEELSDINNKYPHIADRLSKVFVSQVGNMSTKRRRFDDSLIPDLYTRKRHAHGREYYHEKIFLTDLHDNLRKLSLNVLGASIIKDLDDDEFEYSLFAYEKLKTCFLELYAERISKEEVILSEISKVEV